MLKLTSFLMTVTLLIGNLGAIAVSAHFGDSVEETQLIEVVSITEKDTYSLYSNDGLNTVEENEDLLDFSLETVTFDEPKDLKDLAEIKNILEMVDENSANDEIDEATFPEKTLTASSKIRLQSLKHDTSDNLEEPFPTNKTVSFSYIIANTGDTDAVNILLNYYIARHGKTFSNLGHATLAKLPAGYYTIARFGVNTSFQSGTFTIKVGSSSSNSIQGDFQWGGIQIEPNVSTGLCAYSMQLLDQKYTFSTMEYKDISVEIANFSEQDLTNVEFTVKYNVDGKVGYIEKTLDSLPAKKGKQYIIRIKFRKAGDYTFLLTVDPNKKQQDNDRSDNTLSEIYHVNFDTHFLGNNKKWADARDINIIIDESLTSFVSADTIQTCVQDWDGITSRVDFSSSTFDVKPVSEWPDENDRDGKLFFALIPTLGKGVVANTKNMPEGDSTIRYSTIRIADSVFSSLSEGGNPVEVCQKKTLTHEVGHALGLDHPYSDIDDIVNTGCADKAIMWQFAQKDFYSLNVEEHDEYNIKKRYQ